MESGTLTHRDCVRLLRSAGPSRCGSVSIDGLAPVLLACLVLDDGDVLIPALPDSPLVRAAALRPVAVEFACGDPGAGGHWTVRGIGLARLLAGSDVPRPRTTVLATLPHAGGGLRVVVARYHGTRTPSVAIPLPRPGESG
ncbi:hypothetical protein [Amycolatopsis benzoatilytica]|uniref:hypothetical protein n=1 Tax=Amycolatopsis benzoatilytica TaxID=346045 RepID=UPI000372B9A1|nr:hypothetical protein [Amycolatopsis benzoatilytica]